MSDKRVSEMSDAEIRELARSSLAPARTDEAAAYRAALAAVAEALDVPDGEVQERSDRAIIVRQVILSVLAGGGDSRTEVRYLRERFAARNKTAPKGREGSDG